MSRSHKTLGFLLVAVFGIYGCAKGPTDTAPAGRPAGEARAQRLEEDFRSAAAARDQFRQKLLAAEEKQAQLQKQLDQARATTTAITSQRDAAILERDGLKADLKARTTERDALATQYDGFRKNIRELLGQAETSRNATPNNPAVAGTQPATGTGSALSN